MTIKIPKHITTCDSTSMLKLFISLTVLSTAIAVNLVGSVSASPQRFAYNSLVSVTKTTASKSAPYNNNLISDTSFGSNTLFLNQYLIQDQYLSSSDGRFKLILQADGNLVLYVNATGRAVWASNTVGTGGTRLYMQDDGNLVILNQFSQPIWATNTAGYPDSRLIVQNDRNVVIYTPTNQAIWSTNTVEPRVRPDPDDCRPRPRQICP